MKLASYQVQHIAQYIDAQSIWYTDIKDELIDHIASAIEHKMEQEQMSFADAFGLAIDEIDSEKIQRQKMLRSFTMPYHFMLKRSLLRNILILGAAFSLVTLFYTFGGTLSIMDKWISSVMIVVATAPAVFALTAQKHKPWKMSYFMSAVLGCFMYVQLIDAFKHLVLDSLLAESMLRSITFHGLSLFVIFTGYELILHSYNKVKRHAMA